MTSDIFSLAAAEMTAAQIASMFWSIFTTALVIAFVLEIVMYVFRSVGLYTIARRRGIKRPWLAWIPLCDFWIVGSISDNARLIKKNVVEKRRWLLLLLLGITTIANFVLNLSNLEALLTPFMNADRLTTDEFLLELECALEQYENGGTESGLGALLSLALAAAEITGLVFYYMSLYELYASCKPGQKVVFLVLSILFNLQPFFIFACRKHDEGMQPAQGQLPSREDSPWQDQNPEESDWQPPQNPDQTEI